MSGAVQPIISYGASGGGSKVWIQLVTGFENDAQPFVQISYLNSGWVITGGVGQVVAFTSPDSVTWTKHLVSNANQSTRGCAFSGGVYAVSAFVSSAAHTVYTSANLTAWTAHDVPGWSPTNDAMNNIVAGGGVFLWVNQNGQYATSPDGSTWTIQTVYAPTSWGQPVWDGTRFIAPVMNPGNQPRIATSTDGVHWAEAAAVPTFIDPAIIGNNGTTQYIVGNGSNDVGDSINGALTVASAISFSDAGNPTEDVVYSGVSWARCNVNNQNLQSSSDGLTWVEDTVPGTASFFNSIALGAGKLIAVGGGTLTNNFAATRGP